jgi:VanZ family protein
MPNSRGPRFWISAWLPVAAGIAAVLAESTAGFGTDHTGHPLRWLVQLLFGTLKDSTWDLIHFFIRKAGHFLFYGTLGLLWLRAWRRTLRSYSFAFCAGLAMAGTLLAAIYDEWHQSTLPNRTGSPWDVALDCCGALALLAVGSLFLRTRRREPIG